MRVLPGAMQLVALRSFKIQLFPAQCFSQPGADRPCCLPVQVWTGNTAATDPIVAEHRANCRGAISRNLSRFPERSALCRLVLRRPASAPSACYSHDSFKGLETVCGLRFSQVMLFLGGASAVCSPVSFEPVGEVSLLGGELALPLSGGPRQPLDRQI